MDRDGGRKLLHAFLGIGGESLTAGNTAMSHLPVPARVLPLNTMIEHLLALGEETWFDYAWSREPLEGKFSREQRLAYASRAAACGRREGELLLDGMEMGAAGTGTGDHTTGTGGHTAGTGAHTAETGAYGAKAGAGIAGSGLRKLAEHMGLKVSSPRVPNGGGHVIFAQYQEPDSITIYMDSVDKAGMLIEEEGLHGLLGYRTVEDVLLAHELFHAIEYRKRDSIYTQTETVELWRKPFSNRSRLICLGEIAGMEFARRLTGIPYTPYVLDVLMMYGYDKGAATALYEEIVAFAGEGAGKER